MFFEVFIIVLFTIIGAVTQTVAGLGFLLFLTPALLLFLDPVSAIATALIAGLVLNVFVLYAEDRKREILWQQRKG